MSKAKNIIFDLGGIFLNIDYEKVKNAFIAIGVSNFHELYTQTDAGKLFESLEEGTISACEFYEAFREATIRSLTDEQISGAWNTMLLDFPFERLEWLDRVRVKYKVFLFSNTNKIHYERFMDIFRQDTGRHSFNDFFIKAYYSHELGLRKPDPASFVRILEEQELNACETLFIDDSLQNIEGAQKVGLQTIHLTHPKTVLDLEL